MNIHNFTIIFLLFINHATATIQYALRDIDADTIGITITVPVAKNDFLYKDYISFSVDHPDIQLSPWKSNIESTSHYDTRFKDSKKIFNKDVTITLTAQKKSDAIKHARLYFNYYLHSKNHIAEIIFPLITKKNDTSSETQNQLTTQPKNVVWDNKSTALPRNKIHDLKDWYTTQVGPYTHSRFIQIITLLLFIGALALFLYFHNQILFFIEIKRIALWCAIATIIYLSKFIIASHYTIHIAALLCAITGIFYSIESDKTTSRPWRHVKTIIAVLLLAAAFPLLFYGVKVHFIKHPYH